MGETHDEFNGSVGITVELTGEYDAVVEKLRMPTDEQESLGLVLADFSRLLETVQRLDGGTRSVIVDHLPPEMHHAYDAEAVVDALQILSRYDLVALDGNTWTPGPALTA
ncbi:hypothetical protein [Natrinema soli]|uniref:Uncharacterized protein n=1 Tax=Natrinema soli TaxID=1930624 RepID=A0ABD5SP24_9EURY|nr:hypothetical protein [Natrinema soli]